jgi:formate dehydrogenase major subunit
LPNADCILIIGSNFAEAHPVGFQWVMEARKAGTKVIHVDPRFSRTGASSDMFVPIRAGTDIAFVGGLINHVLANDLYFDEFVRAYTNATHLISEDIQLPDELDGLFSGWDPDTGEYESSSWSYQYEGGTQPACDLPRRGRGQQGEGAGSHTPGPIRTDPTMTDPQCVLQLMKRHYSRYTPEKVAEICGIPVDAFRRVADTFCSASGRERTAYICYAVGLTMHSKGVQNIRALGVLQLLLGNIGRPGGGILALRGHANVQGATDLPLLYDLLPGYLSQPHVENVDLAHYLKRYRPDTGWWSEYSKYIVSLLKAWYGDAATAGNDWAFEYLPRIDGDHSYMTTLAAMADGAVKGYFVVGENPIVSTVHGALQRKAFRELDWLVVRDLTMIETAEFWRVGTEYDNGAVRPEDVATEVFLFPAAAHVEKEGSFTNTQRLLQWKDKAVPPPGDARSELWFAYHLMRRMKELYAESTDPKDAPILNGVWDYPLDEDGDPSAEAVIAELNGSDADGPIGSFTALRDDGSTRSGSWIHAGVYAGGENLAARRKPGSEQDWVALEWGWAWPANRRNLYNRASADPDGVPWSERKKYVWWDTDQGRWVGYDVPDFIVTRPPDYRPGPDATGTDAIGGADPFILKSDGKGWLWGGSALRDGPLPTHYEPIESVARNALYRQQNNPDRLEWIRPDNPYHWAYDDPRYPFVLTSYRLTETFGSGTMANRNLPWLGELQPEAFCEVSPELAAERDLHNGDWAILSTARAEVELKVLVTRRMHPLRVGDRTIHQIGLPYQWGPTGIISGDNLNMLFKFSGDPNVTIEECKALTVDIRPGRLDRHRSVVTDGPLRPEPPGTAPARDVFDSSRRPIDEHGMRGAKDQVVRPRPDADPEDGGAS